MQTHGQSRDYRWFDVDSFITRVSVVGVFGLLLAAFFSVDSASAHVQTTCLAGDQSHFVVESETFSGCISQDTATHSAYARPVARKITASHTINRGTANAFIYGQCTWWAALRYHQMHGVYVPWRMNANAWQWKARAVQYGWHVSSRPKVGDIMVLQPKVQGAGWSGHVGIVEQVLGHGIIVVSSMNWYPTPRTVTRRRFHLGHGVSFISV